MDKSTLRRRITPSVPFILHVEDETGTRDMSFKIAFDFNALALVEEELGMESLLSDIGQLLQKPSVKSISVMFWAGIQEAHPEYEGREGLQVIRSLISLQQAAAVHTACVKAFLAQLPKDVRERLEKQAEEASADAAAPLVTGQLN